MSGKISSPEDLHPGDIMFGPIGGAAGVLVGLGQLMLHEGWSVGPVKIRHVGIVTEASRRIPPVSTYRGQVYEIGVITAPKLVQAMPSGAEEVDLTYDAHWTRRHAYVRLPEDYTGQAGDAAAIARLMVGTPYSFLSYAALAAWRFGLGTPRLEKWIDRRTDSDPALPREAICSVLVDQAWTLAGKKVMAGVPHQCVTPGALAARLLLDTPGARWTFPGRSGVTS